MPVFQQSLRPQAIPHVAGKLASMHDLEGEVQQSVQQINPPHMWVFITVAVRCHKLERAAPYAVNCGVTCSPLCQLSYF